MLEFEKINIDKIWVKRASKRFSYLSYFGETIEIMTPEMICEFGIENEYSNYLIKLRFDGEDDRISDFYRFVKDFESFLRKTFDKNVKSLLKEKEGFLPSLIVKIPNKKGNLKIDVYDKDKRLVSPNLIKNNTRLRCLLEIKLVWKDDNRNLCTCKWSASEIYLS